AVSTLDELATGTFQEVIKDDLPDPKKVETAVFVSGKLYYELLEEREKTGNTRSALVRLEQLYPFHAEKVAEIIKSYPNLKNVVWAQEEPQNMGAYQYIYFRFLDLFAKYKMNFRLQYAGRPERSSPATGSVYRHKVEQAEVIQQALSI
ncbi:MAG: 2-oxoglutarate dehydrogenase subunit E1, partial [Bdellovibrionaceae bacterium]|nr:2-oxoglutarate dehydrogenase subunit E1 [Pseudobdellovibrionaceae bacterium]